jgi:uncharacterized protein YceK
MKRFVAAVAAIVLSGCATYRTTLTDAQGRQITCEASGKNGIITGHYLRAEFDQCIAAANSAGYK